MTIWGLIGFAALVVGFGLLLWLTAGRSSVNRRKGLDQLAAKRDWSIDLRLPSGGRGLRVEILPQDGAVWSCNILWYNEDPGTVIRTTEFRDAPVGQGLFLLGPPLAAGQARLAEGLLGAMRGTIGQMLLARLTNGIDPALVAGLRLDPEQSRRMGATVFAAEFAGLSLVEARNIHPGAASYHKQVASAALYSGSRLLHGLVAKSLEMNSR